MGLNLQKSSDLYLQKSSDRQVVMKMVNQNRAHEKLPLKSPAAHVLPESDTNHHQPQFFFPLSPSFHFNRGSWAIKKFFPKTRNGSI